MSVYMVVGTPEQPAVSTDITCRREWIAGGRFLHDVTEGSFAGSPYYRQELLGYSNVDQRYEWITVDDANANMMIYLGKDGTGPRLPIIMRGVTDQGWPGEDVAGKPVNMRKARDFLFAAKCSMRGSGAALGSVPRLCRPPAGIEAAAERKEAGAEVS